MDRFQIHMLEGEDAQRQYDAVGPVLKQAIFVASDMTGYNSAAVALIYLDILIGQFVAVDGDAARTLIEAGLILAENGEAVDVRNGEIWRAQAVHTLFGKIMLAGAVPEGRG